MPEVNIYLDAMPKSPLCAQGAYAYTLEYHGKTLTGSGRREQTTFHRLILQCAIEAVSRMKVPGNLTIHAPAKYLCSGTEYLKIWEKNGWRNAKGEPLANADLWKEWADCCRRHKITMQFGTRNQYVEKMQEEMEKTNGMQSNRK